MKVITYLFLALLLFSYTNVNCAGEIDNVSGNFTVIFPDDSHQAANAVLNAAEKAKKIVEENLGRYINEKITINYAATQNEFFAISKSKNENILAYANAHKRQIIINGEALKKQDIEGLYKTLVHEYGHIYLGLYLSGDIPQWLNEGLVMHLAGEGSFFRNMNIMKAHALNNLLSFRDMDIGFPSLREKMSLAYDQSYSIVDFLLKKYNYGGNSLKDFIDALADKKQGPKLIENFWDPFHRDMIEKSWRENLGNRLWSWIVIFSSGTLFWSLMAVLFIFAYLKKRAVRIRKEQSWEKEDYVYSSLSKEDEKEFWTPLENEDEEEKWRGDEHPESKF